VALAPAPPARQACVASRYVAPRRRW